MVNDTHIKFVSVRRYLLHSESVMGLIYLIYIAIGTFSVLFYESVSEISEKKEKSGFEVEIQAQHNKWVNHAFFQEKQGN